MKKRFTKLAALTGLLAMVAMSAMGCKKVECDVCGETKKCTTEEIFGEEVSICKDCQKELEDAANALEDLLD